MLFLSLSFARVWPFRHIMSLSHPHMHPHLHSHMHPKLRQFNWSRSPNRLILWLNHLLIDFFDPNLKPEFNSSWQNWLKAVRIRWKLSILIKNSQNKLEMDKFNQKWLNLIENGQNQSTFRLILTFLIF